jgi:hypothetical protein
VAILLVAEQASQAAIQQELQALVVAPNEQDLKLPLPFAQLHQQEQAVIEQVLLISEDLNQVHELGRAMMLAFAHPGVQVAELLVMELGLRHILVEQMWYS